MNLFGTLFVSYCDVLNLLEYKSFQYDNITNANKEGAGTDANRARFHAIYTFPPIIL